MRAFVLSILCGVFIFNADAAAPDPMNAVAEKYAHLVLALGQHDPDYVDAFYGPAEWKTDAEKDFLAAMRADPDERLACQTRILGDVRVEVEDA